MSTLCILKFITSLVLVLIKVTQKKGKEDAFIEIPDLYNVFVNSSYLR